MTRPKMFDMFTSLGFTDRKAAELAENAAGMAEDLVDDDAPDFEWLKKLDEVE